MTSEALAVIVLAAGCSQRFGPVNKLLVPLWGKPLVYWSSQAFQALPWMRRIAVLGHQAALVSPFFDGWMQARNPRYQQDGHQGSLRAGLRILDHCHWQGDVVVALADMPFVQRGDVQALCRSWQGRPPHILAAHLHHQGQPGHPRILGRNLWRTVLADPSFNLRRWFADAVPLTLAIERHCGVITDVDTPQDYLAIQNVVTHQACHG